MALHAAKILIVFHLLYFYLYPLLYCFYSDSGFDKTLMIPMGKLGPRVFSEVI